MSHVTTDVSTDRQGRQLSSRSNGDGVPPRSADENRQGGTAVNGRTRLGVGLGWLSVGLACCQLIAPRRLARLIGVSDGRRTVTLMRALGARELTAGIGLLTRRRSSPWLWARVAGDIVDLALLGNVLRSRKADRLRVGSALAAVAGVTLLDAWAGRRAGAAQALPPPRQPIRRSTTIARPPAEIYRFWRDFQNLPKFMVHLESVETLDSKRSYWRARSVGGKTFEWNAEIVEDRENELIAWCTVGGSQVAHAGMVRFVAAPGGRGTEVHVEATYDPPGGVFGRAIALVVGQEPSQQIEGDLRRLKQVMETGEVIESDASVHRGVHPARPSVAPRIRKHRGQS